MADSNHVLRLAVEEAALMAETQGDHDTVEWYEETIKPLVLLARDALFAENGVIDDERVRDGGLPPAKLTQLGL